MNIQEASQYFLITLPKDEKQKEAYALARKALSNMILEQPSDTYSEMDYIRELKEKAKTEKSIKTEINLNLIENLIRRAKFVEFERDIAIKLMKTAEARAEKAEKELDNFLAESERVMFYPFGRKEE